MPKLALPKVTLCAVDTVCHELCSMAVEECLERADFGDIKIFSDQSICRDTIRIESLSGLAVGDFVYNKMPYHIKTDFVLFIQWDSWIIDIEMWSNQFLNYDYVGAPWAYTDGMNVGNNGFCLRSLRLMKYLAEHRDQFPIGEREDDLLCRHHQKWLPQFKWAPEPIALDFAFERSRQSVESRHFGFHGIFNWPFVLPPAKLAQRMELARKNPYLQKSDHLNQIAQIARNTWLKPPSCIS